MLVGHKPVENRPKRLLRKGWHALHLGLGTGPYNQLAAELHPDLVRGRDYHPQSEWSGAIVGLIFVSEHRSQEQCNSHPWALGPVCHVISHAVELSRPVRHLGQQGSWRIDQGAKYEIRRQLDNRLVILRTLDVSPLGPAPEDKLIRGNRGSYEEATRKFLPKEKASKKVLARPKASRKVNGSWRIDQEAKYTIQQQVAQKNGIQRTLDVSPLGPAPEEAATKFMTKGTEHEMQ